jgi:NADPH-dependent 2,4-dienoyl-CoA reductase/sulfur reductase-like enzyme
MSEETYEYIIVGGGLAGDSAIKGIRELDASGSIALIAAEKQRPYDRPPLSKDLWLGKKQVSEVFLEEEEFYRSAGVELVLGREVSEIDVGERRLRDAGGASYGYRKLLLATGGRPRTLDIPGGDVPGICYFRYLDDYLRSRERAAEGKSALVIGGGFIGSEMAAALNSSKLEVTMLFPESRLLERIFPEALARALQEDFGNRGVRVLAGDLPVSCEPRGERVMVQTRAGRQLEADLVIAGLGILPAAELAQKAGLKVGNGIEVNDRLQSSHPEVYAAGDNAFFPYQALGTSTRLEHWDNARKQGKQAGRNLAGAEEAFTDMPYFYSDLFDFGFEAVGEISSRLESFADWRKENDTGVIYYLKEGRVRGVMLCNVWKKLKAARELIKAGKQMRPEDLRGAIR